MRDVNFPTSSRPCYSAAARLVLCCSLLAAVGAGPAFRRSNKDRVPHSFPRSVREGWVARLSAPKAHAGLIGC